MSALIAYEPPGIYPLRLLGCFLSLPLRPEEEILQPSPNPEGKLWPFSGVKSEILIQPLKYEPPFYVFRTLTFQALKYGETVLHGNMVLHVDIVGMKRKLQKDGDGSLQCLTKTPQDATLANSPGERVERNGAMEEGIVQHAGSPCRKKGESKDIAPAERRSDDPALAGSHKSNDVNGDGVGVDEEDNATSDKCSPEDDDAEGEYDGDGDEEVNENSVQGTPEDEAEDEDKGKNEEVNIVEGDPSHPSQARRLLRRETIKTAYWIHSQHTLRKAIATHNKMLLRTALWVISQYHIDGTRAMAAARHHAVAGASASAPAANPHGSTAVELKNNLHDAAAEPHYEQNRPSIMR